MERYLTLMLILAFLFLGCSNGGECPGSPTRSLPPNDQAILDHSLQLGEGGRQIFRFDTFGSEAFWGDALKLHQAIAGEANGGVGPGLSPNAALALGLKVDMDALPTAVGDRIPSGQVNLDDPATTLELLKLDAVVGIKGTFDANNQTLTAVGLRCAVCHSTVDNAFAEGIG